MSEGPLGYDREFVARFSPVVRLRLGYSHDRGEVTRFVVQLEYELRGQWEVVVRFDHDPESVHGHDVTEEGIHVDVYRNGRKQRTEAVGPPMPANAALTFAEEHLNEHDKRYVERFETWHGIRNQ